jgi:hypothetical protein
MNVSDFWAHMDTTIQLGYPETASAPPNTLARPRYTERTQDAGCVACEQEK